MLSLSSLKKSSFALTFFFFFFFPFALFLDLEDFEDFESSAKSTPKSFADLGVGEGPF
jgi:hypothetical protein